MYKLTLSYQRSLCAMKSDKSQKQCVFYIKYNDRVCDMELENFHLWFHLCFIR